MYDRRIKDETDTVLTHDTGPVSGKVEDLELSTLGNMMWRGRWVLLIALMVSVSLGAFYTFRVKIPLYTATTVIVMDAGGNDLMNRTLAVTGLTGDSEEVLTEVEIFQSRRLASKVVEELNLVDDPEFNHLLRGEGLTSRAKGVVSGWIDTYWPSLTVPPGPGWSEDELTSAQLSELEFDDVVTALLDRLSVSNVPKSLAFRLSVETQSPVKSARIANTLAELYIADQIAVKFEETERAIEWLSSRVTQFQQDLETAEADLSTFSSSIQLVSVEMLKAQEVQLKDLRDRISQTEASAKEARVVLAGLSATQDRAAKAALINDTSLEALVQSGLNTAAAQERFDTRLFLLEQQLQIRAERLEQQIPTLEASEAQLAAQLAQQSEDLIVLQQFAREAEAERLQYEYFLGRLKETRAQQGIQQADSRVVSEAVIPRKTSAPNYTVNLILAAFIGLQLGIVCLVFLERRKTGLRSARDLERRFGYSVLGQIPVAPGRTRQRILKYLIDKPASAVAEAYRSLRTSVMMSITDRPPQVILNTSCVPGEGKTTNSLGLAHNLKGMGKKVLLVEGDIRRRTLDNYFPDMPDTLGLISAMEGRVSLDEAVYLDPASGLHVLSGEATNVNAADVFSSKAFRDLVDQMRAEFDAIVIDCPPVLVVPDARIMAPHADAVLFTVRWDSTSEYEVEEALRIFHSSGQRISGFILGQIDLQRMKDYGSHGQYSAYSNYGSSYYHN